MPKKIKTTKILSTCLLAVLGTPVFSPIFRSKFGVYVADPFIFGKTKLRETYRAVGFKNQFFKLKQQKNVSSQ